MNSKLYSEAKELVCHTLEIPEDELGDRTLFVDDLGIDSILIVELKTKFEEKYRIKIGKEELRGLTSLQDIVHYLSARDVA